MLQHNKKIQELFKKHGLKIKAKYIKAGSLRGCWRIYNLSINWNNDIAKKINRMGFVDFDRKPLGIFSGNGGVLSIFIRGHEELLK